MESIINQHLSSGDFNVKNLMYPSFNICGVSAVAFLSSFSKRSLFVGHHGMRTKSFPIIQQNHQQGSCITIKKPLSLLSIKKKTKNEVSKGRDMSNKVPRIAIIGGGICGVTAAKSIAARIPTYGLKKKIDITIYEADITSLNGNNEPNEENEHNETFRQSDWKAATARNANSLVPGAAMHVMSQRGNIYNILKDFVGVKYAEVFNTSYPQDDFTKIPPYFGFSPWRCIGISTSWQERFCFLTFMYHFLKTSFLSSQEDVKLRGKYLVQIANSNRFALTKELNMNKDNGDGKLIQTLRLHSGFISVHRTKKTAEDAVREALEFGETAELLSLQDALDLEPQLKNLPFRKSFFVHRPNDQTANCLAYVISVIKSFGAMDIKYKNDVGSVTRIENIVSTSSKGRFKVTTANGSDCYDYVILANGIFTPLLATHLSPRAGLACPTFPLKGYSFTLSDFIRGGSHNRSNRSENFLKKPLSFDNIYCTSVDSGMVRLAGFGEIVGFPKDVNDYHQSSDIAKSVFLKYANAIFGKDLKIRSELVVPCYRPMSPDDLPIVGEVESFPGLYLHTGHGTLGWTLSLATADCLAQCIYDDIQGIDKKKTDTFLLPNGTVIPKKILSPNRFY